MPDFHIDQYKSQDWSALSELLAAYPFKPFADYTSWPEDAINALFLSRVENEINQLGSTAWLARFGGEITGFADVVPLDWDSQQLGWSSSRVGYLYSVGDYDQQIEVKAGVLDQVETHCLRTGLNIDIRAYLWY